MDCRHVRGVDKAGFCRTCGEPADGTLAEKRKKRNQRMAEIDKLLNSGYTIRDEDREHWQEEFKKLSHMQI